MKSLYDVFAAIKADEGDHVGTMKACLDPNVAVQSPSLERNVLIGLAMAVAVTYAINGDLGGINEVSDLVDSAAGDAATGFVDGSIVEAAIAGAAGFAKQFMQDEEEGNIVELAGDFVEASGIAGFLDGLGKVLLDVLTVLFEFLARLL
jgi:hypothetical protein